jgi:hypothetical protein
MCLAHWRPVWLAAATTVLTFFLVACARTETVMPFKDDPVDALCWRILSPIAEFQDAMDKSGTGEPEVVVRQAKTAAKHIETAIEISRRQEAEFSDYDLEWVEGVDLSAKAYVAISEGGLEQLTDDEAMEALSRIDAWFKYAADQCVGTTA